MQSHVCHEFICNQPVESIQSDHMTAEAPNFDLSQIPWPELTRGDLDKVADYKEEGSLAVGVASLIDKDDVPSMLSRLNITTEGSLQGWAISWYRFVARSFLNTRHYIYLGEPSPWQEVKPKLLAELLHTSEQEEELRLASLDESSILKEADKILREKKIRNLFREGEIKVVEFLVAEEREKQLQGRYLNSQEADARLLGLDKGFTRFSEVYQEAQSSGL